MKLKIALFILIAFSPVLPQQFLSLEEAIKTALKNNYSINIARNEAEIAENDFSIGNAGMLPDIDVNASYSESITNTKQEFYDGRKAERTGAKSTTLGSGITLNWTIFDGLSMFASLDLLKSLRESGKLNFKLQVEDDITEIILTYYDIVRLEEVLEVIRTNIKISEERVRIAEDKLEVGSGSRFDLRQAQVNLNEDRSSLLREELNLSAAKVRLNNLLGKTGYEDFRVVDTIIFKEDLIYNDLLILSKENNTRLKLADENRSISQLEMNIARSDLFPVISLNAGYNFTRSESEAGLLHINRNMGFNYGITASLSLFNGLTTRLAIENASLNIENSKLLYMETEQTVTSDLLNIFNRYENSRKIVSLEKENLTAAQENIDIALERLRLGNITPLEFRETQINLFNAKSRLVSAQFEAKSAETELLKLSGQLIRE